MAAARQKEINVSMAVVATITRGSVTTRFWGDGWSEVLFPIDGYAGSVDHGVIDLENEYEVRHL